MNCKTKTILVLATLLGADLAGAADSKCELKRFAELPVTMSTGRPVVAGQVNGVPATFYVDSGAFFSSLSNRFADQLQLRLGSDPSSSRHVGPSGPTNAKLTTVKKFSLVGLGTKALSDVQFLVEPQNFDYAGPVGVLGQNVVGSTDSEYDLANGVIRLFKSEHCGTQPLSYWSRTVSMTKIDPTTPATPHFVGSMFVNGKRVSALFDSNYPYSVITLSAAERAGFDPKAEGVVASETKFGGSEKNVRTWLWRFDSVSFGEGQEAINNARIRVVDMNYEGLSDVVLGLDFFLSHRIYFAKTQRLAYFTYNGGPVFNLRLDAPSKSAASTAIATSDSNHAPEAKGAQEFRLRGAASLARNDLQSAIADLEQAVKLDPNNAQSYHDRAMAYWRLDKHELALEDMNKVVAMRPENSQVLFERGRLRVLNDDTAGALEDFQAASRLSPDNAQIEYQIAETYRYTKKYEEAIRLYEQWAAKFPKDSQIADALNEACWLRLTKTKQYDIGLADCNASVKARRTQRNLDSRGMAWLLNGNYDKAIADYNDAIKLRSKSPWSLYGLSVAESRKGKIADAAKHREAALAVRASIGDEFKELGIEQ